ncbi:MAG: glycosyltransferase, partial [Desulfuromonas sp.]|nr:glycosyltransferase [Desulfuromonas sp.]
MVETDGAAGGDLSFPVPVSRKGTILELLRLPDNVTRLLLEPMRSTGSFELQELSLTRVGGLERTARMWRRVAPLFFRYPRVRRHRAGFYFRTPLFNLQEAYRIAGRFRANAPELDYEQWIENFDTLTSRDRCLIRKQIGRWRNPPSFRVIVTVDSNDADGLRRTIDSVQRQFYRNVGVLLLVAPRAGFDHEVLPFDRGIEALIARSDAELVELANSGVQNGNSSAWVVCMHPGEVLAEHALYWFAYEAIDNEEAGFIYADHDHLRENGKRTAPVFKPDWSPELLRSTNYIGASAAVRADLLDRAGGLTAGALTDPDRHDLYLRVTERLAGNAIRHIPAVLWHLPGQLAGITATPVSTGGSPVAEHLQRLGIAATVERSAAGHFRVNYALPAEPPTVSIIVPTRDALPHLRACIESVLGMSSYARFELLVVDNQSCEPETLAYLEELAQKPRVRVLHYPHPFNYSAINNFAAEHATGDVLC